MNWSVYGFLNSQRHDIFKKRIDSHGNVIEVRKDGIGAPKVSGNLTLFYCSVRSGPLFPSFALIKFVPVFVETDIVCFLSLNIIGNNTFFMLTWLWIPKYVLEIAASHCFKSAEAYAFRLMKPPSTSLH